MTATGAPLRRRRPILTAVLLLLAHSVVVFALVMLGLSIALSVGGPTIGRDELYRLGPALQLAVVGAVAPFALSALLTWVFGLLAPRRAWLVPIVAICASVLLWAVAMLFLRTPEPIPGG
jgi:hypothetical protein